MSSPRIGRVLCAGLVCGLLATPVPAQETIQGPAATAAAAAAAAENSPMRFVVEGNTLLPAAEVAQLLPPLPAPVSLDAIRASADRLQQAYQRAGYAAVVVNIPEQTIADGAIRLDVVEGKVAQVYLNGNRLFSDENILRSLPSLRKAETPKLPAIDANLLQVNENPAKASRITFQPGQFPGQVDALVVTDERAPQQITLGLDNTGSEATGRYRASVALQHANLFQRDHLLGLRGEVSPTDAGSSYAGSLSYGVPFYEYLSALEFTAGYSDVESKAIPTAAGDALFAGSGDAVGVRYRRYLPRIGQIRHRLQLGVDLRNYNNECSVGQLGPAGCGTAGTDISVRPLTLGYDARTADRYSFNLQYSRNLWPGGSDGRQRDFDAARPGADARYGVLRGGFSAAHRFSGGSGVLWRNLFQYSPDALVSSEQNGLGGAATVRGYEERELVGDKGVTSTLELSSRPFNLWTPDNAAPNQASGVAFADWGQVRNNLGTFCDNQGSSCQLSSVGLGLRWAYRNRLFLRADVARTLEATQQTQEGDYKLHFSLGYGL